MVREQLVTFLTLRQRDTWSQNSLSHKRDHEVSPPRPAQVHRARAGSPCRRFRSHAADCSASKPSADAQARAAAVVTHASACTEARARPDGAFDDPDALQGTNRVGQRDG